MESSETDSANRSQLKPLIGLLVGPVLGVLVYLAMPLELESGIRETAAIGVLMAVFWICESMPLPVTAMIPIVAFPVCGILSIEESTSPFAKPVIFLFMGGFMMARAVEDCGLHRRIALSMLKLSGQTTGRLLGGFMLATAFLSMWISNTAAVVMMIPIVTSMVTVLMDKHAIHCPGNEIEKFEKALLLGVAYAASIGGLGTIVGTPPNALLIGALKDVGVTIGFGRWMLFAFPLVVAFLFLAWWFFCKFVLGDRFRRLKVDLRSVDEQIADMGTWTRAQRTVLIIFVATAGLWVLREPIQSWEFLVETFPFIGKVEDATISVMAAIALFLVPVDSTGKRALDWNGARHLPWGVLLLIGGGMSLATGMSESGLGTWIAEQLILINGLPLFILILVITAFTIFLTEVTSNTATIAALLPVLAGLGMQMESGPMTLMVPAALAASCAFMLPVATPPNAVVFDSGKIRMGEMMRYGFWFNLMGIALIPLWAYFVGKLVLGV